MALDFDGVNQYITIGDVAGLDLERTDRFSFSVWVNGDTLTAGRSIYVKLPTPVDGPGYFFRLFGGAPNLRLTNTNVVNALDVTSNGSIATGAWHHIVMTYDGSSTAAGVLFYIDGVVQTNTVAFDTLSATILNNDNFYIAARDAGTLARFDGKMEDCRVYNRTLSGNEVETIYGCKGTDGIVFGLVTRWQMHELNTGSIASGTGVVKDVSNNKYDGTPVNGPIYADSTLRFRRKVSSG